MMDIAFPSFHAGRPAVLGWWLGLPMALCTGAWGPTHGSWCIVHIHWLVLAACFCVWGAGGMGSLMVMLMVINILDFSTLQQDGPCLEKLP